MRAGHRQHHMVSSFKRSRSASVDLPHSSTCETLGLPLAFHKLGGGASVAARQLVAVAPGPLQPANW